MKKILVTGAAGFLGAHLCEKLQNLHYKKLYGILYFASHKFLNFRIFFDIIFNCDC